MLLSTPLEKATRDLLKLSEELNPKYISGIEQNKKKASGEGVAVMEGMLFLILFLRKSVKCCFCE